MTPIKFLTAVAAVTTAVHGLEVSTGTVQPIDERFGGLTLQQQWTLSSANGNTQHLTELVLRAFGEVAVEHAPNAKWTGDDVASVIFYSDTEDILNLFEVVPHGDEGADLKVKNKDAEAEGRVFARVALRSPEHLEKVSISGSSDVFISDGVLAQDSPVDFSISGSGDLNVGLTSELAVDSLKVSVSGSGDIRIKSPTLSIANELKVAISGSGDVEVEAQALSLGSYEVAVSGSGNIRFSSETPSSCSTGTISVSGNGDVDTASVACDRVAITVAGSGDVRFQAVDELEATLVGSGDLEYVNARPKHVSVKSVFKHEKLEHGSYRPKTYHPVKPENWAIHVYHVVAHISSSFFGSEPSIHISQSYPAWFDGGWSMGMMSLASTVSSLDAGVLVIAVGAGVAVGVAIYLRIRSNRRRGYDALV